MKIETKYNRGDIVRIDGHTGPVTDISVWVTDTGTEIEYRIDPPGGTLMDSGLWAVENKVVSDD